MIIRRAVNNLAMDSWTAQRRREDCRSFKTDEGTMSIAKGESLDFGDTHANALVVSRASLVSNTRSICCPQQLRIEVFLDHQP